MMVQALQRSKKRTQWPMLAGWLACAALAASGLSAAPALAANDDPAFKAYENGDYLAAMLEAKSAAEQGEASAFTLLGRMHEEGFGAPQDFDKASTYYTEGARLGDVNAKFALAMMLVRGSLRGVQKDYKLAAQLFEEAAESGIAEAQYNLALLYVNGTGRDTDMVRAAYWMEKSAVQRYAPAQYDLGALYLSGEGVARDEKAAAKWIGRAADRGLPEAQLEYAIMLVKGQGLAVDKEAAVRYLRASAESGNPVAQNRLARLFAYGDIVEPNLVEAAKWHLLARERGASDFSLDRYVSRLTDEERAKAAAAAAAWLDRTLADRY